MIIHLDADAFFASVEQAEAPELRGKAMAVGGQRRGIIASASYEARARGVYTPMPSVQARRICPELILVSGSFEKYRQYSRRMFAYAEEFTPLIERTSIDEAYFDLSSNPRVDPVTAAAKMQASISRDLGITASFGIGANKLVAQIASKLRKPNALVEVARGTEREFLAPLESKWLPGVGDKLGERLREAGLHQVQQIAEAPMSLLSQLAGSYARQLQAYACGIDTRPVVTERADAKSYGMQETFDRNVAERDIVLQTLRLMADELMAKVRRDGKSARTVTVGVRYDDMTDATHGASLPLATDLETDIYPLLPRLLREVWQRSASLRLVSLRLSNIGEEAVQTELVFDATAARRSKQHEAACLLDSFREKKLPVMRGHGLPRKS